RLRCAVRGNQMQVTVIAKHKATIKSLRRESYASRARVKALKGALSKLKGALSKSETRVSELHAQASSWAQERSTLKASLAERDRTVEGLQKKLTQLQAEIDAAQRAREIAAKLESEKLSGERELRRLREDVAAYENTMREVFSIAASLFRDKRRAQVTAAEACARADRTRKHLSYRIGSALVQNAVSPAGWARVPGALVRARLDFKRDQSRATNN